jgi:hypothetical protein
VQPGHLAVQRPAQCRRVSSYSAARTSPCRKDSRSSRGTRTPAAIASSTIPTSRTADRPAIRLRSATVGSEPKAIRRTDWAGSDSAYARFIAELDEISLARPVTSSRSSRLTPT